MQQILKKYDQDYIDLDVGRWSIIRFKTILYLLSIINRLERD